MAKLKMDDLERDVKDGEKIIPACEEFGVPFGCQDGLCGSCMIEVVEGMENLTDRTQNENDLGVEGNIRLACQCKIKGGNVRIKY